MIVLSRNLKLFAVLAILYSRVVQVGYNSKADWYVYGFVQDTRSVTGTRRENSRAGFGGTYQVTDKLQMDMEVSNGDLGAGGRLGSN